MIFTTHAQLVPHAYDTVADAIRTQAGDVEYIEIIEQTLPVDRAREIIDRQLMKSDGREKIIVIAFDTATREAQNALLKVVEEPVVGTTFMLVTPNAHILLPTLKSRLSELTLDVDTASKAQAAKKFLKASPQERLDIIKPLIDSKDRRETGRFIRDIANIFREHTTHAGWGSHATTLNTFLSYTDDPASSPKMLLEHLALTLPVT